LFAASTRPCSPVVADEPTTLSACGNKSEYNECFTSFNCLIRLFCSVLLLEFSSAESFSAGLFKLEALLS